MASANRYLSRVKAAGLCAVNAFVPVVVKQRVTRKAAILIDSVRGINSGDKPMGRTPVIAPDCRNAFFFGQKGLMVGLGLQGLKDRQDHPG
jgi:hypothetical protein